MLIEKVHKSLLKIFVLKKWIQFFYKLKMLQKLQYFKEKINQKQVPLRNDFLNKVLRQFKCYLESEITDIKKEEKETKDPMKESKIVVIDKISELDDSYFVILFENTILFINPTNINEISSIFEEYKNMYQL